MILWQLLLSLISGTVPKFQGENFYKNKAIVDQMKQLAARKKCTVAQVALAWVAAQGMISIPGPRADRLEENWASRSVVLTEDEKVEMRKIVDDAKPSGERFSALYESMVGH
jgi:aryl-alcohol dehydrogenase-like predicted oxidoreductase